MATLDNKMSENLLSSRHLVLMFVAVLANSLALSNGSATHLNYAIQVEPVAFLLEPQSTAVLPNTTASFSCNITAVPLISDYPLPRIQWRFNGAITMKSNWRNVASEDGISQLFIERVGSEDVGYYECLALDGQNYDQATAQFLQTWAHTTVSRRARLDLIDFSPVSEVEEIKINSSAPLLLSCDMGSSVPPRGAQWSKDESRLEGSSEDWVVLSDGSLLVFSASPSTSGSYQCMGFVGEHPLNSTSFQVSVTEDTYAGPPWLFLDPTAQPLLEGESINLTCYITGATSSQRELLIITWLKDGTTIDKPDTVEVVRGQVLRLRGGGSDQSGVYTCEVAGERAEGANITVSVPPFANSSQSARIFPDQLVNSALHQLFSIPCLSTGQPTANVYWYRNGEDISSNYSLYNATSGRLTVEIPFGNLSSVLGVYQCFAENSGGVAYSITRVLVRGFINPPGNLTCRAETNYGPGPQVVLNWEPPKFFTGRSADHFYVDYINNRERVYVTQLSQQPLSTTISPSSDGLYIFRVFSTGECSSAPALCQLFTLDRITEQEYPITLSCAGSPTAVWNDPSRLYSDLTTTSVLLNGTCIYGNLSNTDETTAEEFNLDYSFYFMMTSTVELSVENVPSGAVCLLGGHHSYGPPTKNTGARPIPTDACIVQAGSSGNSDRPPVTAPTVRLGLSCEGSELRVSWYTSTSECYRVDSITIQGRCLDYTSQWEYESFTTESFAGIETAGQVPSDAVCTFFGFYNNTSGQRLDIEPAQCVAGGPVDERYQLAEASDIAKYPTECPSPSPSPPSLTNISTAVPTSHIIVPTSSPKQTAPAGDKIEDYVWYLLAIVLLLAIVSIVMLLIIVILCLYKRYPSVEKQEMLEPSQDSKGKKIGTKEKTIGHTPVE